ncbi:anhydro-N-acetylmuramic acid kinase [Pedobacter sp. MR2016-24]|uniref:anhydro-N-acetylmuramic acid kinase n=1 Tax=Pedobacter sp. MR2016-24 TaxID=2994466 RepID=UPI002245B05C|nr:anhydro-N-acetylmuramic acid kinase [Pedobacter sp. MR2016-24]MCX2483627.1 anhydro-N-acetylmuramic acid kinase [Pedobacter sp. MR2016-24]
MNTQLARLSAIAASSSRMIIGLMSGTSLDGLDIALCEFSGSGTDTQVKVLHFTTVPYDQSFKEELKSISFKSQVSLQRLTLLHAVIGRRSAEMVLTTLKAWNFPLENVDLIASHGQTIFHAPSSLHQLADYPNATLQIGDGDHIAVRTGIITLSDFRQKHIAAGGEGAPLAVYGDYLLFADATENRILLNIGGIANFTYLPGGMKPDAIFSTDIGPGNTLMDQYVQLNYPGQYYDNNGAIAVQGTISKTLLEALKENEFFGYPFPRTTGPELFDMQYLREAQQRSETEFLPAPDVLATLCEFTAWAIISAIRKTVPDQTFEIYLSGGGMHNPLLADKISKGLALTLKTTADLGIHPDAKEAVLFALLANECMAGGNSNFGDKNSIPNITMGKISLPH